MNKTILAAIFCILGCMPLRAQEVVTGIVVDSKGIPVPGAKVETEDGSQSVITELDGTFRLDLAQPSKKVRVQYSGLQGKTAKIKPNMKVKLGSNSWWKAAPEKWNWFAEGVLAMPNNPGGDLMNPAGGIMIGGLKKLGFYLKGVTNTFGQDYSNELYSDYSLRDYAITKEKTTYWSATAGIIVRLGCPIHLYYGVGYTQYQHFLKDTYGNWLLYEPNTWEGLAVDAGIMLRIKKFTLSFGVTMCSGEDDYDDYSNSQIKVAGNFGIGYSF